MLKTKPQRDPAKIPWPGDRWKFPDESIGVITITLVDEGHLLYTEEGRPEEEAMFVWQFLAWTQRESAVYLPPVEA